MAPTNPQDAPLRGRYERYKQLNRVFETWLVNTARAHLRRPADTPDHPNAAETLQIAEQLCECQPVVQVPPGIITTLEEVIDLRRDAWESYLALVKRISTMDTDKIERSNQGHLHYLRMLQHVSRLLKPLAVFTQRPVQRTPAAEMGTDIALTNRFTALTVEQPSAEPLGEAPSGSMEGTDKAGAASIATQLTTQQEEDENKIFAICCYFQDVKEIRLHLEGVWRRFYEGQIGLDTASFLAESACDIIQSLSEEIKTTFSDEEIIDQMFAYLGLKAGAFDDFESVMAKVHEIFDNESSRAQANIFCVRGWTLAKHFIESCEMERNGITVSQIETNDDAPPVVSGLLKLLSSLIALADTERTKGPKAIGGLNLDWLTGTLVECAYFGDVTTRLVVLCQIMLDTYNTFGENTGFAHEILFQATETTLRSMSRYIDTLPLSWTFERYICQGFFESLQKDLEVITSDKFSGNDEQLAQLKPSTLLKGLPFLAGQMLFDVYFLRHLINLATCIGPSQFLAAAYLYRAAKLATQDEVAWPEMDFFLEAQSKYGPFVLEANDIKGYARHFDLALGFKIFSRGGGEPRSTTTWPLTPNILKEEKTFRVTHSYMNAWFAVERMPDSNTNETRECYTRKYLTVRDGLKQDFTQKQHTPAKLLTDLEAVMSEQAAQLSFDYAGLATQCQKLITRVYHLSNPNDSFTPLATALKEDVRKVLREAAAWAEQTPTQRRRHGGSPVLLQVPSLLEIILEETISSTTTDLASVSLQNEIAEADKPCNRWKWGSGRGATVDAGQNTPDPESMSEEQRTIQGVGDLVHRMKSEKKSLEEIRQAVRTTCNDAFQRSESPYRVRRVDYSKSTPSSLSVAIGNMTREPFASLLGPEMTRLSDADPDERERVLRELMWGHVLPTDQEYFKEL